RRIALRIVSRAARNLPRVPARLLRHAGAGGHAHRSAGAEAPARDGRLRDAVAVRRVAAFQLRRELHLRRRRAAGRTAGAGAPLAERRAQALAVDQSQLRELLGDAELRELLDAESMDAIDRQLQRLDPSYRAKSADGVHDMLLSLGDLTEAEVAERSFTVDVA